MAATVIRRFGLLAGLACGAVAVSAQGTGSVVLLDCYYNNEWRRDSTGVATRYHYVWDDTTNSGFSQLAAIITEIGARPDTLTGPPTASALRRAGIYLIVDPDTPRESPAPHVLDAEAADVIAAWVRDGGILVVLGNDSGNADLGHLNVLASRFGIRFNEDSRNRVVGKQYETGTFANLPSHPVFEGVRRIFLKEVCTMTLSHPAAAFLTDGPDVIMAASRFGRGMVAAVGDPWLYNEYMDTRRLPGGYDNARAGANLFRWLLTQ